MPENVSIAYRGVNYAIGQGPQFYGIWHAAAPQSAPLEWWPLTPEGWSGAWTRFASIEVPGTIAAVTPAPAPAPAVAAPPAAAPAATGAGGPVSAVGAGGPVSAVGADPARVTRTSRIAAALLGLGVVLGIVSLFPSYIDGASLASDSSEVVPHVIYLAAWTLSAALILMVGARLRVGTLIGLGVSAITFGMFFADAGTPMAGGTHLMGAGLVFGILGWIACTAGIAVACRAGFSFRDGLARPARGRVAG